MAAEFNWTIGAMDCFSNKDGKQNVVNVVHWRCTGVDGEHTTSVYSTCSVTEPGELFTPYGDLTQEQVLEWIWDNGVDKDATEQSVQGALDVLANPPVVQPALPWV